VAANVPPLDQYVPVNAFALSTRTGPNGVVLSWPRQRANGARLGYAILRSPQDELSCRERRHAAANCVLYTDFFRVDLVPVGYTRRTAFLDRAPKGEWVYRVAATVSPTRQLAGDYVLISRAATASVTR
jgi:hypothetical protein